MTVASGASLIFDRSNATTVGQRFILNGNLIFRDGDFTPRNGVSSGSGQVAIESGIVRLGIGDTNGAFTGVPVNMLAGAGIDLATKAGFGVSAGGGLEYNNNATSYSAKAAIRYSW